MADPDDAVEPVPGTPWTSYQLRELESMRTHLKRVRTGTVTPGLTLHPGDPMLLKQAHQVDELIAILDRALALGPDDVDVLLIQGEVEHAWRQLFSPDPDASQQ